MALSFSKINKMSPVCTMGSDGKEKIDNIKMAESRRNSLVYGISIHFTLSNF